MGKTSIVCNKKLHAIIAKYYEQAMWQVLVHENQVLN